MTSIRFAAAALLMSFGATSAHAGLEICNQTPVEQSVSIAYKSGDNWASQGWWNIKPGDCALTITSELDNRYYYYRATANNRTFEGENLLFCTLQSAYLIEGDQDCANRGYDQSDFRKIDTGTTARHFTLNLVDPESALRSADTGMASGNLGEPFTYWAVFQGCDVMDGASFCAFHANGWKHFAWYDNGTPDWVLDDLQNLAINAKIEVEGDMAAFYDSTTEVIVRRYQELAPSDELDFMRIKMQGSWVAVGDPNNTIFIEGAEQWDYYSSEFLGIGYLQFAESCDESNGVGPVVLHRNPEGGDTLCYIIYYVDEDDLTLTYTGNGRDIEYRRN